MEQVCPLCNGLEEIKKQCPNCGEQMKDGGKIEDFYGPYSPYMDKNLLSPPEVTMENSQGVCIHLVYCPKCGTDQRFLINELYI